MATQKIINPRREGGSFRDPSGFVFFKEDGTLCRQINFCYREHYDFLINSGLYQDLVAEHLLVAHEEVGLQLAASKEAYCVIQPQWVPFISYPYEWCFSQLKDAALLTLAIQQKAIEHGMILKDASAYNIQFCDGKPILIDTLSFEIYQEGRPWVAYRQFCQHFLAPLALMATVDYRLNQLFFAYLDGIPLDFTAPLLPWWAWFKPGLAVHLLLHAKGQMFFSKRVVDRKSIDKRMSKKDLVAMVEHLRITIKKLEWKAPQKGWLLYAPDNSYCSEALETKKNIVQGYLDKTNPEVILDLGTNLGVFSEIVSKSARFVLAIDNDTACIEHYYQDIKKRGVNNIFPLVVDVANPSPAIGWAHNERRAFLERMVGCDMVLALALTHHLFFFNNVSFEMMADFFARLGKLVVVEFVPKEDKQVQQMLVLRENQFSDYSEDAFESAFKKYFFILRRDPIPHSSRIVYLMQKN